MLKIFKSNAVLSVTILALGVVGLLVLVKLSPQQASSLNQPTQHTTTLMTGQISGASTTLPKDPFAERLLNPLVSQTPVQSNSQNSAVGLQAPIGADPFKEKLSTTSPFGIQR